MEDNDDRIKKRLRLGVRVEEEVALIFNLCGPDGRSGVSRKCQ